jgi:hypothetical protein
MKKYTLVTFILNCETISRYFEGTPTLMQINNITGYCPIIEMQRIKGNFLADYVKAKNLYGYTAR